MPTTESEVRSYQLKYVTTLVKQTGHSLPPGQNPICHIRRPENGVISSPPSRQGPFTLQPTPAELEDSDGDACDIAYVLHGYDGLEQDEELPWNQGLPSTPGKRNREHLGTMLVSYSDGRVDVLLDLEKIEARWEIQSSNADEVRTAGFPLPDRDLTKSDVETTASRRLLL